MADSETPLAAYLDQLMRFARGLGLDEAVAYGIIDDVAASPGANEDRVAEIRRRMLAAAR